MFRIRETTKRSCCRTGFVVLVLLPCAGFAAWCAWLRSDVHAGQCRESLEATLGMPMTAESCSHPRPGVTRYTHLEINNPETGTPAARIAQLDVTRTADAIVVAAPEVELLQPAAQQYLWAAIRRCLVGTSSSARIRLAPTRATLHLGDQTQTIVITEGQLAPTAIGSYLAAGFRPSDAHGTRDARLEVWLDRRQRPAQLSFRVQSGESQLPASLLAVLWPPVEHVGSQCRFQGTLWAQRAGDAWQGEMVGRLSGVDLETLVARQFMLPVSGTADVDVHVAEFRASSLTRLYGSLDAPGGRIGHRLLEAASGVCGCPRGEVDIAPPEIGYDRMQFAFGLEAGQLSLQPAPRETASMITSGGKTVLAVPAKPQPLENLVRLLEPAESGKSLVPASHRAARLIALLPLGSHGETPAVTEVPTEARAR